MSAVGQLLSMQFDLPVLSADFLVKIFSVLVQEFYKGMLQFFVNDACTDFDI